MFTLFHIEKSSGEKSGEYSGSNGEGLNSEKLFGRRKTSYEFILWNISLQYLLCNIFFSISLSNREIHPESG